MFAKVFDLKEMTAYSILMFDFLVFVASAIVLIASPDSVTMMGNAVLATTMGLSILYVVVGMVHAKLYSDLELSSLAAMMIIMFIVIVFEMI
ncbi:hypothetical protein [Lentilactobacillus sp. Marseille-Q4993]|uniref:hypothetical protein n=1 Tax=Lentilactobacillus sp. Marseille-Q4993 TaxID=3039492 RepID=UPI0024BC8E5B|nr:hypothetical protein [Lentilactobacillus sp. Marseille-Q4993]